MKAPICQETCRRSPGTALGGWGIFILLLAAVSCGPLLRAQTRADCLTCHSDSTLTKERDGKQVSLFVAEPTLDRSPHRKLVCIACHTGFDPGNIPHREKITPVNCTTCHQNVALKHPFHPQLAQALNSGAEPDVSCKDCHGTHDIVSPKVPGSKFFGANVVGACGECHSDVKENFDASAHGKAIASGVTGAPECLTCHRNAIVGSGAIPDTLAMKTAQVKLCLSCHLDKPEVRSRTSPGAGFIAAYEKSVHGSALAGGNARAANCIDCHGSHQMNRGNEPTSLVNRKNIPATCGKCHAEIASEYGNSIHGTAFAKGNIDAPVCTNCHGEHNILVHTDPNSNVAAANVSTQCSACHGSVRLSEKYGIAGNRTQTYSDTYHGLAVRSGSVAAANCASCHGAHNIKPASDSTSTVNKANLAVTCGKCHPGANTRFSVGSVHIQMNAEQEPSLYWIATVYLVMILVVVGGMLFHNIADFIRKSRRKLKIRRGLEAEEHHGHALYLRMNLSERLQHGTLMVSFTLLVVTGFMLRYPDAWWVASIRSLSGGVFEVRSLLHRAAAVCMVAASLYHIIYVAGTARGRRLVFDLLPRMQDSRDALAVVKYNFGMSKVRPKFGRFSYIEKSEYWALVWGTVIMAATGAIMWFDNTFIGILTKLGYDISRTVHFYEAWLATLAIVVWHLYYVIFNPDTYPMNLAWWKGTITESEMEEEHPLELEEIRRAEIAATEAVPPASSGKANPEPAPAPVIGTPKETP